MSVIHSQPLSTSLLTTCHFIWDNGLIASLSTPLISPVHWDADLEGVMVSTLRAVGGLGWCFHIMGGKLSCQHFGLRKY